MALSGAVALQYKVSFDCEFPYHNDCEYKINQSVRSPITIVGECPICLKVFPAGITSTGGVHVSAYVEVVPQDDWISSWKFSDVAYKIVALNRDTSKHMSKAGTWSFTNEFYDRGWHDMIDRPNFNALRSNGWLADDKLRFHVEVKGSSLGDAQRKRRKRIPSAQEMWHDMKFTDMVICAGEHGTELACHRAVLAMSSEVFSAMLSSAMKEGTGKRLVINNTSEETLRFFLECIYTGSIAEKAIADLASLQELMALGDQYGLHHLVEECARQLSRSISTDNVSQVLRTLHMYARLPDVKEQLEQAKVNVKHDHGLFDALVASL